MKAFTYERAKVSRLTRPRPSRRKQGAKFLAGGTNLLDLMKLEIETPTHLVDVQDLKLDQDRCDTTRAACVSAPLSPTPRWPAMSGCAGITARLVARDCSRRIRPVAQQGDDGGKSPAAHALPIFL